MTLVFTADGLPLFYVLDDEHNPVAANLQTFAAWMEANDKQLALDQIDDVVISTVFLGLDMQRPHLRGGDPVVFETMVFCADNKRMADKFDRMCVRYQHYGSALEGHRAIVDLVVSANEGPAT